MILQRVPVFCLILEFFCTDLVQKIRSLNTDNSKGHTQNTDLFFINLLVLQLLRTLNLDDKRHACSRVAAEWQISGRSVVDVSDQVDKPKCDTLSHMTSATASQPASYFSTTVNHNIYICRPLILCLSILHH